MPQEAYSYHKPVMLRECMQGLNIKEDGIYIDLTFGGGGHAKAILEELTTGHLYAFDQDEDAKSNAEKINKSSFTFIEANFRYLKRYLKMYGIKEVDGILADLGISSHQIDEAARGFSTRFDADLDMRMDRSGEFTAKALVNTYPAEQLQDVLGRYGEVRNAKTLAQAITAARINREIGTVEDLKQILSRYAPKGKENRYYAQVFQALRIEVNDEMTALEEMLGQAVELLKPGGRLVIMSYHSLEDRPVKNFIAKGKAKGDVEKDFYGNITKPMVAVNRKPITASAEEIKENNRARSAKLRVAEKK